MLDLSSLIWPIITVSGAVTTIVFIRWWRNRGDTFLVQYQEPETRPWRGEDTYYNLKYALRDARSFASQYPTDTWRVLVRGKNGQFKKVYKLN